MKRGAANGTCDKASEHQAVCRSHRDAHESGPSRYKLRKAGDEACRWRLRVEPLVGRGEPSWFGPGSFCQLGCVLGGDDFGQFVTNRPPKFVSDIKPLSLASLDGFDGRLVTLRQW